MDKRVKERGEGLATLMARSASSVLGSYVSNWKERACPCKCVSPNPHALAPATGPRRALRTAMWALKVPIEFSAVLPKVSINSVHLGGLEVKRFYRLALI